MTGVLHSINVSRGGVPKLPVASAHVRTGGLDGDSQDDRRFHGGPARAVCIYSLDLIEALRGEGHPIVPGAIGENLTLHGIDWTLVRPDARIGVGEALLEITTSTSPCQKIAGAFADGGFTRVSQKVHPGWSRYYARVLQEGRVSVGDAVRLTPPALLF